MLSFRTSAVMLCAVLAISSPAMAQTRNDTATKTTGTTGGSVTGTGSTVSAPLSNSVSSGWNSQNDYWRTNYANRSYYNKNRDYTAYEPAYRYGVDLYNQNKGKAYDDLSQSDLNKGWTQVRGSSSLSWDDAQMATRDAYNRMVENDRTAAAAQTPSQNPPFSGSVSGASPFAGVPNR